MCGIAGVFDPSGADVEPLLQRMCAVLRHRGPDDTGTFQDRGLGFGHTRLSIIDLAGGHQPLRDQTGTLWLVANGEIYNFVELREDLRQIGHEFLTRSDSEVILRAYAALGLQCLDSLHGMFAFALYDRPKRQVVLARDRLGIKPLFYSLIGGKLLFASELKAIVAALDHTPAVHPPALLQYLQNQFNTGRDTIFTGIHRVMPGEALVFDQDLQHTSHSYWSALNVQPRWLSHDDAAQEFDGLFEQVMREHMRADVPFGLFLSGGVDSAVLAAALTRLQDRPLRTFSVGFSGVTMQDELDDAARIAKLLGTEHRVLALDRAQIFERLPHTVWAADDLMRDYASLPTSWLAETAARELKVVFSGEGGDEVFGGYARYRPGKLESGFKNLLAPGSGGFRTRGQWHFPWAGRVVGKRLREAAHSMREPFITAWRSTPRTWSDLQRRQYTDLTTALPDNLMVKADRMLMAFGLEGRLPFLDHRIVEFGLALPDALKVDRGQGKVFLKRWAERHLPADHLWRRKRGFHVPVGEWLRGAFFAQLAPRLLASAAIGEWFNRRGVEALLKSHHRRNGLSREVWSLMQFAMWHRIFIEGAGTPEPREDPLNWIG